MSKLIVIENRVGYNSNVMDIKTDFDGIIFDVDGTIWDTTSVVAQAWNKAIDENFPNVKHVDSDILKGQFGKTMDVIAQNLFTILNKDEQKILMDKCAEEEQFFLENTTENLKYEGIFETIKILSKKYPLFIVSNCQDGYIPVVIQKNNLGEYIKDTECFGVTGLNKDENIKLIVKRNNLKNPVYVGDTQGDADACKSANVPFIWAKYGFGKVDEKSFITKINCPTDLLNFL